MVHRLARAITVALFVFTIAAVCGLLVRADSPQPIGTWAVSGSVGDGRGGAVSLALPDGRTLVLGGVLADGTTTDSVLVYDPASGATESAGRLLEARTNHAAVLLEDGRVLVSGGDVGSLPSADVEIFDPATGTSVLGAQLAQPRSRHAAARLADGTVLIAGGATIDGQVLNTAALVSPSGDAVIELPATMASARAGATATALIDGRVLVAGGNDGNADLASAEIFDPYAQTFHLTQTSLAVARSGHVAIRLANNNSVLFAGGTANGVPQTAADLFVPAQFPDPYSWGEGTFASAASLSQARTGAFSGPASEGYGFVAGGGAEQAELYHFATIKTDKDDYAPGEYAAITGSGWQPGETVHLLFQEDPAVHDDYAIDVTADSEGNLYWDQWAPEHHDIGVRFFLLARDSQSRAQITFTDSPKVGSVSVSAQSPSLVPAGSSATYTVTVNRGSGSGSNGAFTADLTATLPTGAAATFSPSTVSFASTDSSKTSTLTITTTAATPSGNFIVSAATSVKDFAAGTGALALCAPPAITGQPASQSIVYGDNASFTAAASGAPAPSVQWQVSTNGGASWGDVAGATSATLTLTKPPVADSGKQYRAVFTTSCGTSSATTNAATLTVSKRAVTVTADAKSKTYGDAADPALTYQVTSGSLLTGDSFTGTITRAAGESVGSYAIQQGSLSAGSNYNLSFTEANLTINARSVAVTADPKSKVYGDTDPGLTYQITSGTLAFSDTFSGALSRADGESVGTYAIGQGTLALSANYALTFHGANLTISTRAIAVAADPKGKSYGDADPTLTYEITSGSLVTGDVFTGALTRVSGEDAGTYAIQQGTLTLGSNYNLSFVGANLTIATRAIAVAADAKGKVYGETDPSLTYQTTGGSLVNGDSFSGDLSRVAGEAVGSYAIQQGTLALSANYTLSFTGADLTITKRPVTVTADAKSKTYGDANPGFTYQVTSGDLISGDRFTGALARAAGENVGRYAITQGTLSAGDNYDLTFVGADLTITQRPITLTANAQSKIYGEADPALTYQITDGSLAFSDALTGTLARESGEDVGSYAITAGTLGAGGNYEVSFHGANLEITVRPITVTADAKTKVYGDADPALTYQVTSGGLAFSDAFSGALTRAPGQDVGTYAIQQGTLGLSTNYSLSYIGANLAIERRPITVTADPKSKVYGDDDPGLTYRVTSGSLAFSDTFDGALSRAAGENVGSYAIQQGSLTLDLENYNLTFVGANLTISARPITVTADAKSKVYGDADPALAYQITGGTLVFGDSFSGALTRAAGENVGQYDITQGALALSNNYSVTYVGAKLTISARSVTVTANAQSKVYGEADPALTYQITSGSLAGSDEFTGALTRAAGQNIGNYAIQQGTLALSTNYTLTFVGADLSITERPVTVTAEAKSKVYGYADPALTYGVTSGSLVAGDGFSGALTRVAGENVGAYLIQQGTLALNGNYHLTFVGASLSITQRPISVTADNKTKILGAADPAFTYQITSGSLVSGDAFSGALSRVAGEGIGSYAITQGTLALTTNYVLTLVPGTLQIQYAPATVACAGSAGRTIREPISAVRGSVFKQGSTVPAKFRVCDVNGNSIGTSGVVTAFKLVNTFNGTTSSVNEDVASTTPDTAFRWDGVEQQWIFNITTKPLLKNVTYTYQITLNDGTHFEFAFGLR